MPSLPTKMKIFSILVLISLILGWSLNSWIICSTVSLSGSGFPGHLKMSEKRYESVFFKSFKKIFFPQFWLDLRHLLSPFFKGKVVISIFPFSLYLFFSVDIFINALLNSFATKGPWIPLKTVLLLRVLLILILLQMSNYL